MPFRTRDEDDARADDFRCRGCEANIGRPGLCADCRDERDARAPRASREEN